MESLAIRTEDDKLLWMFKKMCICLVLDRPYRWSLLRIRGLEEGFSSKSNWRGGEWQLKTLAIEIFLPFLE